MLNIYEKTLVNNFNKFDKEVSDKYTHIIKLLSSFDSTNLPNILLYGNECSGKHSLLYSFFTSKRKYKSVNTYKSLTKTFEYIMYHNDEFIELDVENLGIYKKYIIKDVIKSQVESKNINGVNKFIILNNVHLLMEEEQHILRKLLEDYIHICRFIFIGKHINNLLDPIKSRFLTIKTPGFSKDFIKNKMMKLNKKYKINMTEDEIEKNIKKNRYNLKKCILECNIVKNTQTYNNDIEMIEIDDIINTLLDLTKTNNINYTKIDELCYKLIVSYNLNAVDIIKYMFDNITTTKEKLKQIIALNYEYNKLCYMSSNQIVFLQSYIPKLSNILI